LRNIFLQNRAKATEPSLTLLKLRKEQFPQHKVGGWFFCCESAMPVGE
jgi:hypothetical protein